jgi:endonuclease/exonuclease/phosphatase family metal-dependent hydrolase
MQPAGAEVEAAAKMERHLDSLARVIKATRADIVVLQGVPGPEGLDSLQAKLAKLRWHRKFRGYAFFAGESGQPAGIVVLSARPLISFHPPEAAPGSVLAQMECAEARIRLPGKQDLVLYSFRLHRELSLQREEAKALYDLTLPLRRADVNLMLAGCLNSAEPYRPAPTEAAGTADRVLSGANTPSRGDDLVDLDSYLWPNDRATGPGGAECCRILVSPELIADTYKKVDWYLRGVKVVGDKKAAGEAHRAVVARFALR